MRESWRRPPGLSKLLSQAVAGKSKPTAFVPRTQRAIGYAAPIADMTLMFDNSRAPDKAFALVRAQRGKQILFDCRDPQYILDRSLRAVARTWLEKVAGPYKSA